LLERLPCVCRGPRGNPHPWRERQPTVARAFAMCAFAAGRAASLTPPIRGASVSRPSLERFPCVCRGLRGNPHPWRERQPTVARAFSMRLPRAARQSQSVARASADRRSSVFHAFAFERHNESGRLTEPPQPPPTQPLPTRPPPLLTPQPPPTQPLPTRPPPLLTPLPPR